MKSLMPLVDVQSLDAAIAESRERPVLLFKHSRYCGVSCEALDELQSHIEARTEGNAAYKMITVQTHRTSASPRCNSITFFVTLELEGIKGSEAGRSLPLDLRRFDTSKDLTGSFDRPSSPSTLRVSASQAPDAIACGSRQLPDAGARPRQSSALRPRAARAGA